MVAAVDDEPDSDEAPAEAIGAAPPRAPASAQTARLRGMVEANLAAMWRFLRRLGLSEPDADDAIQEVILVAARKLAVIEPGRERAYLLRTSYRIGCRMRARRVEPLDPELPDPLPSADALVEQRRARELLDAILSRMTDELRAVLVLHDVEGLTMAEISQTLELNSGTVASRLRRAREQFEKLVAQAEARIKSGGQSHE